jgi:hypothetical protein
VETRVQVFLSKVQQVEPGSVVNMPSHAIAIKKGQHKEKAEGFREMGTLRCDGCGEFFIGHHPASVDKKLAEKQARWLEKVLLGEHERDKKHPDRIELPT